MKWLVALALPILVTMASLQSTPPNVVGQYKIGRPFLDMTPQPIGLTAIQEKTLIGQEVSINSTSVTACGKSTHVDSVEEETYSADAFLQRYRMRPDQIGLKSPVTELWFKFPLSTAICGNSEGFVLLTDGSHAAFEDGNDYFRLSKIKSRY
jgi:hypothetical protein